MEIKTHQPIDWDLCLELTTNRPKLAQEMLDMFVKDLNNVKNKIDQAFQQQDWKKLQHEIHRLHGATCYCGVPEIKETTEEFETALKKNQVNQIKQFMSKLHKNIADIQTAYKAKNYRK